MRVPLTPALSTKTGSGNVNARMTNCLKEVRKAGERVVARPGLVGVSQFEGDGRGMVCFDGDLIGVFGTTLTRGVVEQQEVEEYLFPGGTSGETQGPLPSSGKWCIALGEDLGGNPLYIAARQGSYTGAKSSDGQTWTSFTLPGSGPFSNSWVRAAYGAGVFVIATYNSVKPIYSEDGGATWQSSTGILDGFLTGDVSYLNGIFVLVGQQSNKYCYTSVDGRTWTERPMPVSELMGDGSSVVGGGDKTVYGNGTYVTVPYNTFRFRSSSDAITWVDRLAPGGLNNYESWLSIAYGAGKFVAIAQNGKTALSTDGASWTYGTQVAPPSGSTWHDITYGSQGFLAVTAQGTAAIKSTDGVNWSSVTGVGGVAFNTVGFYAPGSFSTGYYIITPSNYNYLAFALMPLNTYPPIAYSIFWQGELLYGGGWSPTTNDDHVLNATEDFGETVSVTVLPPAGGAEGGFFFTKDTDIYLLGGATPKIWKLEGSTWGTPVTVESGSVMSEGFVCSSAGLLYDCSATEVWEYDEELDDDLIYPAILCRVTDLETGELLASSTHITGEAGGRLPNVALGELGGQVYGFWSDPLLGQYTVFTVNSAATQTDVYTDSTDWSYYSRPGGGRMVALDGKLYTVFVTEVEGNYQAAVVKLDVTEETLSTVALLETAAPLSEDALLVSIAVHGDGLSVLLGSAELPDIGDGTLFEVPLEGALPPIGAIEAGFYDFAVSPL